MRIRRRLIIAFVALLVPLFALDVYDLAREYRERRVEILRGHRDTAEAVAATVEAFLRDLVDRARAVARVAQGSAAPRAEIQGRLDDMREWGNQMIDIAWAGGDGRILYTDPPELASLGVSVADRPFYRALAGGAEWVISDLFMGRLVPGPTVVVAAAARRRDGRLAGVALIAIRAEIFDRILGRVGASGPGASVAVVDHSGRAVYVGGRPDLGWEQRDWSTTPSIQRALRGEAVLGEGIPSRVDRAVRLGARVPIRTVGWVASVTTPVDVAFSPLRAEAKKRAAILAVITLASLAGAVLLGRRLSRPIEALRGQVEGLAGGDLSRRVELQGRDEVADLGGAFNEMAARLEESWHAVQAKGDEAAVKASRLEALTQLSRLIPLNQGLDRVFDFVVAATGRLLDGEVVMVLLEDRGAGDLVLRASAGVRFPGLRTADRVRQGEGLAGRIWQQRAPLLVPELTDDPRSSNTEWVRAMGLHAYAGVPLTVGVDCIGVVSVMRADPRPFTAADQELLEAFAAHAAIAIENARLYAESETRAVELDKRTRALEALNETARRISSETDFMPLLQEIADSARHLAGSRYAALGVLGAGDQLAHFIQSGLGKEEARRIGDLPTGRGILGVMLRQGRPLRLEDLTAEPRAVGFPPNHPPMRSFMGVPIVVEGSVMGSLYLTEKMGGGPFTDDDERLLMAFAAHAAIALEQARLVRQTREDAATKETLLRELHHRVRNNLASIIGLLSMELTRTGERSAEEAMQACIERVHTIAEVHELLVTGEFGSADLTRVLETVARGCFDVPTQGTAVEVHVDGPSLRLPSRHLTALALIANEVLMNAAKYAFPGRAQGRIHIRTADEGDRITLEIRDDGVGYSGTRSGDGTGLGLEIVQALARADLSGEFRIHADGGTVAVVSFPKPQQAGDTGGTPS